MGNHLRKFLRLPAYGKRASIIRFNELPLKVAIKSYHPGLI